MSKRLGRDHFENLCRDRNHVLTSFDGYAGVQSVLSFRCNICGHEWSSTAASYKNSKTGCWGCKKQKISDTQRGAKRSPEVCQLLSVKATGRPAWNKGIKGSVPGGYNHTARRAPTPEERLLPGILYLIRYLDDSGVHFKLGITRRRLTQRFTSINLVSIIHLHHATYGECYDLEQDCFRHCKQQGWRYSSPTTTELIHPDGLPYLLDRLTSLCPTP
jgi:hypothetical protein